MEDTPRTQIVSQSLAWGLLWLSQFVAWACLMLIQVAAIRLPPRHHALPTHSLDLNLPLLLAAAMASAMTWQGWHSQKNGKGMFKPKKTAGTSSTRKNRVSLLLGGMALFLECLWAFGVPGTRVNWPLLAALNVGLVLGWQGLMWTSRLLPDAPGPDVDPLAPDLLPAPVAEAPQIGLPTAPPTALIAAEAPHMEWLPKRGVERVTPTEIALQADPVLRLWLGLFAVAGMGGMTVGLVLMLFNPGPPHGLFWKAFEFFLLLTMAFFTYICLGVLAPQNLRLVLDMRTYTQESWKPMPGSLGREGYLLVFRPQRLTGSMDEDMAGVCLKEYCREGTVRYLLQLVWKDKSRLPRIFRGYATAEEAKQVMAQAADALGLPALGRCE